MKLTSQLDAFMKNRVNLSDARIDRLNGHVGAVESFLAAGDGVIGSNFLDLIPQGSYAHHTIIKPVGSNDEFDADVLLSMSEVDGWEPKEYVEALYARFRESSIYREKVSRRSRCVTVNYAGDFHMDVVPYLERHGQNYITNRNTNQFELTNPEGFNAWLDAQNRIASGRLVKVIRLAKFIRDLKNNFSVPSVILTILLGERVSGAALWADSNRYSDLPTTFVNLFEDLNDFLQDHELMPSIDDPSCVGENFNHRWDQAQYTTFRRWIKTYSEWLRDAYDEADRDESYRKWRRLLGEEFGTYSTSAILKASAEHLSLSQVTDTDQTLEGRWGLRTQLDPSIQIKLIGRVRGVGIRRAYDLPHRGNLVPKHRTIDFRVEATGLTEPYSLYWKVRNTGTEALRANAIRGQVELDSGSHTRDESTLYIGRHYVEVYVVKNGVCVARSHQPVVVIRN